MTLNELKTTLGLEAVQGEYSDRPISSGYTSDLLSDVMGHAAQGSVLITIQAHKNTVAVATLAGIPAIIICNERPVPEDMIAAARAEDIAVFRTRENQYVTSGRLYALIEGR
jgi:hypothetical protein